MKDIEDPRVTIRILQPVERQGENGETMTFCPGDLEEGVFINKHGQAVINWG